MVRSHSGKAGVALCSLVCLLWTDLAQGADCTNADPLGLMTGVSGDFELIVDPQDPDGNILYVSNTVFAVRSDIVVAQLDPLTGKAFSISTVATNALTPDGKHDNGPEWFVKPGGELGILYPGIGASGVDGVHAVFRNATPSAWDAFLYSVNGAPVRTDLPPVLANTSAGANPAMGPSWFLSTYGQRSGDCQSQCYGAIDGGTLTDVAAALSANGLQYSFSALNINRDGYLFISACDASNRCGIYEAAIDNAGGFLAGSLNKLSDTKMKSPHMVAGQHPITGDTVLFSDTISNGSATINVWQQPASGGALALIGRIPALAGLRHFSAAADEDKLVLVYEVNEGSAAGTYTLSVTANGNILVPGAPKLASKISVGQEVIWLPLQNKWAIYTRYDSDGLLRCWIDP